MYSTKKQLYSIPKAARLFATSALSVGFMASLVFYPSASQAGKNDTGVPAELQGEWRYGRISFVQYQDSYTGQSAAPNGSSDQFQLASNGNYKRNRLIQINTYNCASYLFIEEKGKVKLNLNALPSSPLTARLKGKSAILGVLTLAVIQQKLRLTSGQLRRTIMDSKFWCLKLLMAKVEVITDDLNDHSSCIELNTLRLRIFLFPASPSFPRLFPNL